MVIFLGRPSPKRLLSFFLAGALLVSVGIGLAAVTVLDAANLSSSTQRTVHAAIDIPLGIVAVVVGAHFLLTAPKPKQPKKDSGPSLTQRVLSKDSSWLVFLLGIILDMPGIWYLIALKDIGLADYGTAEKVLLVLGFNVVMFAFIEVPADRLPAGAGMDPQEGRRLQRLASSTWPAPGRLHRGRSRPLPDRARNRGGSMSGYPISLERRLGSRQRAPRRCRVGRRQRHLWLGSGRERPGRPETSPSDEYIPPNLNQVALGHPAPKGER